MSAAVAAAVAASASNTSTISQSSHSQQYSASNNEWSDARIAAFVVVLFFLVCSSLSWMRLGHPVAMILQEIMRQREEEEVQVQQEEASKWDNHHPLTKLAQLSISDGGSDVARTENSAAQADMGESGARIDAISEVCTSTDSTSSMVASAEESSKLFSIHEEVKEMDAALADIQNIKSAIQDTVVKLNMIESKLQSLQDEEGGAAGGTSGKENSGEAVGET
eukprot:768793-Hanusia_phi.AAC.10